MTASFMYRCSLLGFGLAVISLLMILVAGPGHQLEWWDFRTGFTILRWGAYIGIAALMVSLASCFLTRSRERRRGFLWALSGLVMAAISVGVPLSWLYQAQQVPRIHDITTDTKNPPRFVAILPLRADAPNPAQYGGPEIAAKQQQAYPEIEPARFDLPKEAVFEHAMAVARNMGWEMVAAEPTEGRIEATDTTFWFGFKDDVVIRITTTASGSRVDIRSVSRVGLSDLGTNARRIRSFLKELKARVHED